MQGKRILLVGYGKLGQRIAQQLATDNQVTVIKRTPIEAVSNISFCFADFTKLDALQQAFAQLTCQEFDYMIYCVSPTEYTEQGYRDAYLVGLHNIVDSLPGMHSLAHLLFVSSTSVYHQDAGEKVDEDSPCEPQQFSGKVLLQAETFLERIDIPTTTVRFSGIYGGNRSRRIEQVQQALNQNQVLKVIPGLSNRIHEDDCVGFICHLVTLLKQGEAIETCYVASDSCPVSLAEVYRFIAQQIQGDQAQLTLIEDANLPRRAGSKYCVNSRMLETGYELKYPSYREGYCLTTSLN